MASQQPEKVRGVVDMVFLLDVTGSMQPCIEALKSNIAMFIESLTTKDPQNPSPVKDWRAKVVGYRDYDADPEPLRAMGGGDEPESLLDALYKVATIGQAEKGAQTDNPYTWRYRSSAARVVVIFTDAPYKARMSLPEAKGGGFDDVVNVIQANRIILSIFAPELPCYNQLSLIDKSEWDAIPLDGKSPQEALAKFTSDQENFRNTLKQLAKSVSKSADTPEL
jgi:hypothetical protein